MKIYIQAAAFIMFISFMVQVGCVSAIGISPSSISMDFEENANYTYEYRLRGSDQPSDVRISIDCTLSEFIVPDENIVKLSGGEYLYFNVNVKFPSYMVEPGMHNCRLIAEEVPPDSDSGVAAYAAVVGNIFVRVPYPQKYIRAKLTASDVRISDPLKLTVHLDSLGLENVTASGLISISDIDGVNLANVYTSTAFIESLGKGTLNSEWDTKGVPAGRYNAMATVEYGADEPATANGQFRIGDIFVKIINITYPEDIQTGSIVKMEVEVESLWNDDIDDIFIALDVSKHGSDFGSFRSESFGLESWKSAKVPIFWDTGDAEAGVYNALMVVHYANKTSEESFDIEIRQPFPYLLLIAIIVLAVVIAVLSFIVYKKRKKNR